MGHRFPARMNRPLRTSSAMNAAMQPDSFPRHSSALSVCPAGRFGGSGTRTHGCVPSSGR